MLRKKARFVCISATLVQVLLVCGCAKQSTSVPDSDSNEHNAYRVPADFEFLKRPRETTPSKVSIGFSILAYETYSNIHCHVGIHGSRRIDDPFEQGVKQPYKKNPDRRPLSEFITGYGAYREYSDAQRFSNFNENGYYQSVDQSIGLCKKLAAGLNSFPEEMPMICERKYPAAQGFTVPVWVPVKKEDIKWEVIRQLYFLRRAESFSAIEPQQEAIWAHELRNLQQRALSDTFLWEARFDLDNARSRRRKAEHVYKIYDDSFDHGGGAYAKQLDPKLFVVDKQNNLDMRYHSLFLGATDVFIYRGETYLSYWSRKGHDQAPEINFHKIQMLKNQLSIGEPICTLTYKLFEESSNDKNDH